MESDVFIEKIKTISNNYENNLNKSHQKNNGIYYTDFVLASKIVNDLLLPFVNKEKLWQKKFLEPASGIGVFVFAYLDFISKKYELKEKEVFELYKNLYVCDRDENALFIYKKLLFESSRAFFNVDLPKDFKPNIGGALIFDLNENNYKYQPIEDYFPNTKFDIIITNPPYKSLRAERRHYETKEEYQNARDKYYHIKREAGRRYKMINPNNTNFFHFFVEDCLNNYSNKNALISLLVPSTILTDNYCDLIRKDLLTKHDLFKVVGINEDNDFINAKQALCYLCIKKGQETTKVDVIKDIEKGFVVTLDAKEILDQENCEIIRFSNEEEHDLYFSMKRFPKIKDFPEIKIMRGELDVTFSKDFITKEKTDYPLLNGRNIPSPFTVKPSGDYVLSDFISSSGKSFYITRQRGAGQQVANQTKKRRLNFAVIPPKTVLVNTCNFIYVEGNLEGINLFYILGLLNSYPYNLFFKIFSSNNHVNVYEIENLPLPTDKIFMNKITNLAKEFYENPSKEKQKELDEEVLRFFKDFSKQPK